MIGRPATTRRRRVGTEAEILADLNIDAFDMLLIFDQPNAPADALATLGGDLDAQLLRFGQSGGVAVALDGGSGRGEMPWFLGTSGVLNVVDERLTTGLTLENLAFTDAVGLGVLSSCLAPARTVSFSLAGPVEGRRGGHRRSGLEPTGRGAHGRPQAVGAAHARQLALPAPSMLPAPAQARAARAAPRAQQMTTPPRAERRIACRARSLLGRSWKMRPPPLVVVLVGAALGCGEPCAKLETRLCADLGEADCARWRASPQHGPPGGDRLSCDLILSDGKYYQNGLRSVRDGLAASASAKPSAAASASR